MEARGKLSVDVCGLGLESIGLLVVEMWGEHSPHSRNSAPGQMLKGQWMASEWCNGLQIFIEVRGNPSADDCALLLESIDPGAVEIWGLQPPALVTGD